MPLPPLPSALRPRLRMKLALLAGSATALVVAGSLWLATRNASGALLALIREESVVDGEELRGMLETQMTTGDRAALDRLVADIGRTPTVVWAGALDDGGRVVSSSDRSAIGTRVAPGSPEMARLRAAAAGAARTEAIERPGGDLLRTVTPLLNGPRCWGCHDRARPVNGALVVDHSLAPLRRAVAASTAGAFLAGIAALAILLLSLGIAVERTVLQRLAALRRATLRLGAGDFSARAADDGRDELGDLARDFNAMAWRLDQAVAASEEERRRLGEILDGIADGVVILDRALGIVRVNPAFRRRLAGGPGAPGDGAYRELAARAMRPSAEGLLPAERAFRSGRLEKQALSVLTADGAHHEEVYAQPLRGPSGAVTAVIEVWRDVGERTALEAELEQAERLAALGMLATSVAHEVGNPLASIVMAVDGLLDRLGEPAGSAPGETREYLEIVRAQVFRCRAVTERLLGFGCARAVALSEVDAAAALREVLALVGPQARAQGVELACQVPGAVPVHASDQHLQQIFFNLVLNAVRAMPTGGVLTITARAAGGAVEVAFADTGPGIPEALRGRLFRPAVRGTGPDPGAGIGLFISHTLAARCGGELVAASEAGRGATFTVRLRPAVAAPAAEAC